LNAIGSGVVDRLCVDAAGEHEAALAEAAAAETDEVAITILALSEVLVVIVEEIAFALKKPGDVSTSALEALRPPFIPPPLPFLTTCQPSSASPSTPFMMDAATAFSLNLKCA